MKKAFTLIEALIIIAIIGILSSIVIVNLSSAKKKAQDTRIKADLVQIQQFAETVFRDHGKYNWSPDPTQADINHLDLCWQPEVLNLQSNCNAPNGTTNSTCAATTSQKKGDIFVSGATASHCEDKKNAAKYYIWTNLASSTSSNPKYFCVDSGGHQTTGATKPDDDDPLITECP